MAAEFRRKRSGTRAVRRIVRKELEKAAQGLARQSALGDARLHDVRKCLKKARAGLRLLRPLAGRRRYRRLNAALRDAARPLMEVRDAKVLIDTIGVLMRSTSMPRRRALARARVVLDRHRRAARRRLLAKRSTLRRARRAIETTGDRIRDQITDRRGWSVLGPGVARTYRTARRAFSAAWTEPTNENLHELRKQAKYLWHGLTMLEPMRPPPVRRLGELAHRLSDSLGLDHDLAVLGESLFQQTGEIPEEDLLLIVQMTVPRRRKLQADAMALGKLLFEKPPGVFVAGLETYWKRA